MLYLIGLGLNEKGISLEGLEVIKKCRKVYLEDYTVNFPYKKEKLEKIINKKIISVNREFVENKIDELIKEAKKEDVVLLIYGSPLTATTHISLIQELKKEKIKYEVIHNASILDALTVTGLQIYKFGKISSMPGFEADSFIDIIKENQKINAHSLILVDIDLEFRDAISKLEKTAKRKKLKISKLVICQSLGTKNQKIFYMMVSKLKDKKIKKPFSIIIPSELHFVEKEFLEEL